MAVCISGTKPTNNPCRELDAARPYRLNLYADRLEGRVAVGEARVAHLKVMMIGAVGGLAAYGIVILLIYLFRMIGLTD